MAGILPRRPRGVAAGRKTDAPSAFPRGDPDSSPAPVVSVATLGCKANQYDGQAIAELFRARGFETAPFPSPASLYVVVSCCVTAEAVRKTRQL
ncbi:MAG: hypothetical protein ACM3X6_02755, partial [Patescibacteria group bacterium]